jgi:hypothetical protein
VSAPTLAEVENAIKVAHVVYECVVAAGAAGIPSGHLYAVTMPAFSSVGAYEACVGMLVKCGLLERRGLLLHATLPQ